MRGRDSVKRCPSPDPSPDRRLLSRLPCRAVTGIRGDERRLPRRPAPLNVSAVSRLLPRGTVTFLFTDIEGSTRLVHEHGDEYGRLLAQHHRLLRNTWECHGGVEVDTAGDAFFVAFSDAGQAAAAARSAQAALTTTPLRVRMGLHTGEAAIGPTGYFGLNVHRAARIAAVAHGGQILLSDATCKLVSDDVIDLGLHRLKDLSEPARLYQLGDGQFPPPRTLYATNLPLQPNPLVGRERELAELGTLLATERLITLTGPGGTGKTRLALHAAAEATERFRDGVWFVPLSAITDASLVPSAIAQVLGFKAELRDELRTKQLLLVLDNLEQVVDAAAGLADVLAGAADVHIVATSRRPLALAAEREFAVSPLDIQAGVMLFLERATRAGRNVDAGDDVVGIVRAVDGLPLAIELAAARTRHLTPAQIGERLQSSIDLLRAESRDSPARQRTLRATIEWSYDLLADGERSAFARLAVFPGGFGLDAAESAIDVDVYTLAGLVDNSLLRTTANGRFFMLETIRAFAVERLADDPGAAAWSERHALYFADLLPVLDPDLRGPAQRETIALIGAEDANIRRALDVLEELDDPRPGARLAGACAYYWYLTGQVGEGYQRARRAHARLAGRQVPERGPAANACALLAFMSGDAAHVEPFAQEALEWSRREGNTSGVLRALNGLACVADVEGARTINAEIVDVARAGGEPWYLALGLCNLGVAERELGRFEPARRTLLEAFDVISTVGDVHLEAGTLCNLAHVERRLAEPDAAHEHFRLALAALEGHSLPEMVIWCLDGLASTERDHARGAVLLGAAEALTASTSFDHPQTRAELDATRAALEEILGAERAAALRAEGAAAELDEALVLALGSDAHGSTSPRPNA